MPARFPLGQTVATPGALEALEDSNQAPTEFLCRHSAGDWGIVDAEVQQANEDALLHGDRLLSSYRTSKGQ